MIGGAFRYNAENVRYSATPWLTGDGSTSSGTLLDRHGNPISSGKLERVNAIHRTDWQGRQLLYATARTNVLKYSNDFTNAVWAKIAGGTGSMPVVTPAYASGPDGVAGSASRIQLNRGTGTSSSDYSLLRQPVASPSPASRSIWVKSNTGANQTFALVATDATQVVIATTAWAKVKGTRAFAANQFDISNYGPVPTTQSLDVLVAFAQLESGLTETPYIPTTTAAVTVTDYTLTGPSVALGQVPDVGAVLDWDGVAKR